MDKVIVRKRNWKRDNLEPVSHEVRYVCPAWSDHGHWVLRGDGGVSVTRYVLRPAPRREIDEVWLAMEDDAQDPLIARRRIRGKQSVRELHAKDAEDRERE